MNLEAVQKDLQHEPARGTMRRDIATAYLVTAARIGGWLVISATVYRRLGRPAFALLTLVRSTVGLLGNTSLGLAPAMISELAKVARTPSGSVPHPRAAMAVEADLPLVVLPQLEPDEEVASVPPLSSPPQHSTAAGIYSNGLALALVLGAIGYLASFLYGRFFTTLHRVPAGFSARQMFVMAFSMGGGIVARMMSDVPAAVLQTRSRIALDNLFVAASETLWVVLGAVALLAGGPLASVGVAFFISNLGLITARFLAGVKLAGRPSRSMVNRQAMGALLAFGAMVAVAELSDFLYAPTDYILINRLLDPVDVATYAPAVQIDGALLLLVTAVADVLLPKTALAHHAGDRELVRRYYFLGTLGTAALLTVAGAGAWATAPLTFKFWLGQKLYTTRAILPLVLIHTVIGGSSAVGRSILLGMGKVKPFTVAVLFAAVGNVILSYVFVRYFGLGLRGIVLGTIAAVCASLRRVATLVCAANATPRSRAGTSLIAPSCPVSL